MGDVTKIVPEAISGFAAASHAAGEAVRNAASADVGATFAAAAAAIGPIGAPHYLPALGTALANHVNAALAVGDAYHGIGHVASGTSAAHVAADNA
ncbi:hypothetical protein [Mycobacterium sp. SP-6446]|uniref:hypothetical protein n=1 Tax=Mycobacterium sp. SP-6446 TaxID=1834162 RepID=UPI00096C6AFD|nr:hypothetical protein [Mycobacterium sp. SP-6446]